ncbi:MAG: hypothetical protein K0U68_07110 [Gammaproteobacteria bacterium]|nr:hypothetical protein [Gammaproteobacteria bacterium]
MIPETEVAQNQVFLNGIELLFFNSAKKYSKNVAWQASDSCASRSQWEGRILDPIVIQTTRPLIPLHACPALDNCKGN